MFAYILRRLLLLVPTLVGVTVVVFFTMAAAPGGLGNIKVRESGALTQGMDAKKQLERTKRRYRLDLPVAVQYLWWANQISPVGFELSHQLRWPQADHDAVRAQLAQLPLAMEAGLTDEERKLALDEAERAVLGMAAYAGLTPTDAAKKFEQALARPEAGLALLDLMDVKPLQPEDEVKKLKDIQAHYGLARTQAKFIEYYRGESEGRSRILWGSPKIKAPDLGESIQGRSVLGLIEESLPISLILNLISLPLIYLVAVVSGVYAARRPGGRWDVSSAISFMMLWSVPVVVAGTMLQTFLTNNQYVRWFPTTQLHDLNADGMAFFPSFGPNGFQRGYALDFAWCLVLPVTCMVYAGFAELSRVMRGSVLEAMSSDYIRTARAKGVAEPELLWRHAFRNSTLPLITMLSGVIPSMIAGALVVEIIFDINGIGKMMIDAARNNDPDVVMANVLVVSLLALLCDIGRDVAYAIADPRVSYE